VAWGKRAKLSVNGLAKSHRLSACASWSSWCRVTSHSHWGCRGEGHSKHVLCKDLMAYYTKRVVVCVPIAGVPK
jgi:hypothetical protein